MAITLVGGILIHMHGNTCLNVQAINGEIFQLIHYAPHICLKQAALAYLPTQSQFCLNKALWKQDEFNLVRINFTNCSTMNRANSQVCCFHLPHLFFPETKSARKQSFCSAQYKTNINIFHEKRQIKIPPWVQTTHLV